MATSVSTRLEASQSHLGAFAVVGIVALLGVGYYAPSLAAVAIALVAVAFTAEFGYLLLYGDVARIALRPLTFAAVVSLAISIFLGGVLVLRAGGGGWSYIVFGWILGFALVTTLAFVFSADLEQRGTRVLGAVIVVLALVVGGYASLHVLGVVTDGSTATVIASAFSTVVLLLGISPGWATSPREVEER